MKKQAPSNILLFLTALACSTLSASAFYVIQPVPLTATTHSSKLSPRFLSDSSDNDTSLRTKLRNLTGISLTAVRATLRATTGISMTALYTAAYLATSDVVRNIMAFVLQVLPTWARYFVQPFLILYYVPLFVIRTWSDRNAYAVKEEHHRALISNWKGAIETAGKIAGEGYWPVKVNEDGIIEFVPPPDPTMPIMDLNSAIAESIDVTMQVKDDGVFGGCDI